MLTDKVENTIDKFRMLNNGDKVLVGVSGGPDSICLVYILKDLIKTRRLKLTLFHLNHKLREEDSGIDADFVRGLAETLGLPLYLEEVDTKKELKARNLSEEEGARILRYEFLHKVAKEIGAQKIALGHTKDDQAETVLMRLIKGSGLLGLQGIPPSRDLQGIAIVRPLFDIWRSEILAYLEKHRINYRIDKSNSSPAYFRNRIRHELLPYLAREFNPNIKEILTNMAENMGISYEFLNKQGLRKFKASTMDNNGKIVLDLEKIKGYHTAVKREIFRNTIKVLKGNLRRINYQHWKEFESLMQDRPDGSIVDLPDDISIKKEKRKIVFFRKG